MKIFYSWQSWGDRKTNQNFIQDAIEKAIERIKSDELLKLEPVLDRDTLGEAGSVAIADTIFRKIDECDVFVCDVTPIAKVSVREENNAVPNPNVLIELGYATAKLGWEKIIMVVNTSDCNVKELPFDLRHRRLLRYQYVRGENEKNAQHSLIRGMEEAIKIISQKQLSKPSTIELTIIEKVKLLISENKEIELEDLVKEHVRQAHKLFTSEEFYSERNLLLHTPQQTYDQVCQICFELYFKYIKDTLTIFAALSSYGNQRFFPYTQSAIASWMETPNSDEKVSMWRYIPVVLLIYAFGIPTSYRRHWDDLNQLLTKTSTRDFYTTNSYTSTICFLGKHFYLELYRFINNGLGKASRAFVGSYIELLLRPIFEDLRVSGKEFDNAFDLFEMLLAIVYMKATPPREFGGDWMIPHHANTFNRSWSTVRDFWHKGGQEKNAFGLIKAGTVSNSADIESLLDRYEKLCETFNKGPFIWYEKPSYLQAYQEGLRGS